MDTPQTNPSSNAGFLPGENVIPHNHDGSNSPKVDYNDLLNAPSSSGTVHAAAAKMSVDESLAGSSTATQITFDTKIFDVAGHDFTATNPFYGWYPTIVSGTQYYQVNLKVVFDDGANTETYSAFIYKNGSEYNRISTKPGGSVVTSLMLSDVIPMTTNDNLQFYAACSNGGRKILAEGSQPGTRVSIFQIQ